MTYAQMLKHIDDGGVATWRDTDGSLMHIRRAGGWMQVCWSNEYEWWPFDLDGERARWIGEPFFVAEGE